MNNIPRILLRAKDTVFRYLSYLQITWMYYCSFSGYKGKRRIIMTYNALLRYKKRNEVQNKIRVAWFTPFNIESAIGRYSRNAAEALSEYANVSIFVTQKKNLLTTSLPILYWDNSSIHQLLSGFDIIVYNMGDNLKYHCAIYECFLKHPGVVIIHDICLHNFFRGYYLVHQKNEKAYTDELDRLYGKNARKEIVHAAQSLDDWRQLDLCGYGFTEKVAELADAIIVHSNYHMRWIKRCYDGPSAIMPLLYVNGISIPSELHQIHECHSNKLNILSVGMVNPNKRIDAVIEAIGSSAKLREGVTYTVIGSCENKSFEQKLNQLVQKYDLHQSVHFLGFVSHEKLSFYYRDADLICNLRVPALEGGSASLIEQMQIGKCVVVSNTGVYAEMPDDCVIKISIENEREDLTHALERIASDKSITQTYGKKARALIAKQYSAERYGYQMAHFLHTIAFQAPMRDLAIQMGTQLIRMGATQDMQIFDRIKQEIVTLFQCDR